jgi:uncharacterized protein involved in propanediol utilization
MVTKTTFQPLMDSLDPRVIQELVQGCQIPDFSQRLESGPLYGHGTASGHFGEIFQGALAFSAASGGPESAWRQRHPSLAKRLISKAERALPLGSTRALVDLPCPSLQSRVTVRLTRAPESKTSADCPDMEKTLRAIRIVLILLGVGDCGIHVSRTSNIPCGKGAGSTSADATAGIRAVENAYGLRLPDQVVGHALCLAEGASNPVHLDQPVLFAHRRGLVLRSLAPRWPDFVALGIEPEGTILTDALTPLHYGVEDLREDAVHIQALARGFARRDITELARVSTRVAVRDRRLPHDHRRLAELVKDYGAAGYTVAHSGVMAALLWPPGRRSLMAREAARRELATEGQTLWAWCVG